MKVYIKRFYPTKGAKGHPNTNSVGNISEHRLQAATALGKALPKDTCIHHFEEELVICQDQAYHMFLHLRQKALETVGDKNKRSCALCHQYDDAKNMVQIHVKTTNRQYWYHKKCNANKADKRRRRLGVLSRWRYKQNCYE